MLTPWLPQIRQSLLGHQTGQGILELEAKFGFYTPDNKFVSDVPYIHYERLMKHMSALPNVVKDAPQISQVTQMGTTRRIAITGVDEAPDEIIWQDKSNLQNFDLQDYDIRVSLNREIPVPEVKPFNPTSLRDRVRTTFHLENDLLNLDMTEVSSIINSKRQSKYEVELEFRGDVNQIQVFIVYVENIFKWLHGSNLLYTVNNKNAMLRDIGPMLGSTRQNTIDRELLTQARNIKPRDLVYGGIVGNTSIRKDLQNVLTANKTGTSYALTYKADGLRKLLIIHKTGIWLVYPPYEYNLVMDVTTKAAQLDLLLNKFSGTVLDGEQVESKKSSHRYVAFDCLALQGNSGVQRSSYLERLKIPTSLSRVLQTNVLSVDIKKTVELKTPEDFFSNVNSFLNEKDKLDYPEDGLMFIPIDVIYNPHSDDLPLKDRVLTHVPDTCKWKPVGDITIDFVLKRIPGNKIELYSYDKVSKQNVPFHGDQINPLTPDMIAYDDPMLIGVDPKQVVEFEWRNDKFYPRKLRTDKLVPNDIQVALDDWKDIMDPVTEEYIRGQNLNMSFAYHNRIKRDLYKQIPIGSSILDIGSGRGGDINKWIPLNNKIVAVEPNAENREEFLRRLKIYNMENRVRLVPTGGEDTVAISKAVKEFIPGGKVDVVTLMLSMSFFWASESHLEALIQTIVNNIKPGGSIYFLTIDGDALEQKVDTDLILGPLKIHLYPKSSPPFGRPVDFILPGTIVGEQREYVVHLQDFLERLQKYGFSQTSREVANKEPLLSQINKEYTSLYSYGSYKNTNNLLPKTEIKQNIVLPQIPAPISLTKPEMNVVQLPVITPVEIPVIPVAPKPILNNQLPALHVKYTGRGGHVLAGPAINDDTYEPLKCTWYNNLVRIATIGEGSCFIHAIEKAFDKHYQENNGAKFRINRVANLRRDLGLLLAREDPNYPGHMFWSTAARGSFPRMVMQEITQEDLIQELNVDYSLSGLQRLFNSNTWLGDEVYTFIANVLGIDIYVLRATAEDLFPHSHTHKPGVNKPSIVVIGNTYHYEVLALDNGTEFQTVFSEQDDFLQKLRNLFIGDNFQDILVDTPFDPDATFVEDFVQIFMTPDGLRIPPEINEIFPDVDPFITTMNRLMPQIQEYAANFTR